MDRQETAARGLLYAIVLAILLGAFWYGPQYWADYDVQPVPFSLKRRLFIHGLQLGFALVAVALFLFRRPILANAPRFNFTLLTVAILFGILELLTRGFLCTPLAGATVRKRALAYGQCGYYGRYLPHHYMNYHGNPEYTSLDGVDSHNALGLRGPEVVVPKPSGLYRVVVMGGSSTYTTKVASWREDYARRLQENLRAGYGYDGIEVVNAGLGGWTTWESLINLQNKLLDLEPDLLVVYHAVNDVGARMVRPDQYRPDNSGRVTQWREKPKPIPFRSALVRVVVGDPAWQRRFINTETQAHSVFVTGFVEKLQGTPAETLAANPPVHFVRNLRSILAIAKEFEIDAVLVKWAYSDQFGPYSYLASPHYQTAVAEMNDLIGEVGGSRGVPVYDFPADMPMDREYWVDGAHVNAKGAVLKGQLIGDFIRNQGVMDDAVLRLRAGG